MDVQRAVIRAAIVLLIVDAPAAAQVDFTGQWAPLYHEDTIERIPGPELGDYTGLPLTEAARLRADSWDPDRISIVQEYQCRPHSSDYALRGLAPMRIWADYDPAATPGLLEDGYEFYSTDGAQRAREVLEQFGGGHVIVSVLGPIFKCPGAPNETALMVHDYLSKRGLREKSTIQIP